MKTWTNTDKTEWGDGPWLHESDKIQWIDPETDLDCLIVRNPRGALCGYVGVPPGSPWHGLHYDDPQLPSTNVHGGLTFSRSCRESDDPSEGICHVPEPGRPDDVWWFGFDCAHAGDLMPADNLRWLPELTGYSETYRNRRIRHGGSGQSRPAALHRRGTVMADCDVRVVALTGETIGLMCEPCYGIQPFAVWNSGRGHPDPTPDDLAEAARAHRHGGPVSLNRGLPPRDADDLRAAARKVVDGVISSGSGPAAPCFDEHDRAVERRRGSWHVIDGQALDNLRAVLADG